MKFEMLQSAVVEELVSRVAAFLEGRYKLQDDVEGKLQRLKELLVEIKIVGEATAGKEIKNKNLLKRLKEINDVVRQAGDLIQAIEPRCVERANASPSFSAFKLFRTAIGVAAKVLLPCAEDVKQLSVLVEKLEGITSKFGSLIALLSFDAESNKPRSTGRCPTAGLPTNLHSLVGRENEKEGIITFLLRKEPHGVRNVPVLPIIGAGGIGKTAVAQLVYNDERVKSHFSLTMWVCVSESFDAFKLTNEILDQTDSHTGYGGFKSFNKLQAILKEKLSKEIFLLVIDDVQNETGKEAWDRLKAPLNSGKEGSKILLTTRLEKVAKSMGTMNPVKVEGLPEEEYLSLFEECAFGGAKLEEHPRLAAIGKKIVSELEGSPLAARTVGALLQDKFDCDHWERIYESKMWESELDQDF
ncbi:disease resistance protein RGA2-like [Typha latifolia]|uniref:disease resistance protein RGA2-like n=1 Tax=Typha latifolia TaxID=4733 RepID=UPI003C2EBA57